MVNTVVTKNIEECVVGVKMYNVDLLNEKWRYTESIATPHSNAVTFKLSGEILNIDQITSTLKSNKTTDKHSLV